MAAIAVVLAAGQRRGDVVADRVRFSNATHDTLQPIAYACTQIVLNNLRDQSYG
jgi:hypothetical protein